MTATPKAALVQQLTARPKETTPIGMAIRDDIIAMCKEEPFDLRKIRSVGEVARHGRNLLACRDPVAAFDAKRGMMLGAEVGPPPQLPGDDEIEEYGGPYSIGQRRTWRNGRGQTLPEDALKDNVLAAAVKTEILEIAKKEPFAATELLEIQTLAMHALQALMARLGLSSVSRDLCGLGHGGNFMLGQYSPGFGQAGALATSPETFGATVARELLGALRKVVESFQNDPSKMVLAAAAARERGMDELADELEARLRGKQPGPKAATEEKKEG